MSIYLQLPIVAAIVVYIVDVSGFTQSWRGLVARCLKVREENLRPLKPFDCGLCMTWWTCLAYALAVGELSLLTVAEAALLSHLSIPIGALLVFIREGLARIIDIITPK